MAKKTVLNNNVIFDHLCNSILAVIKSFCTNYSSSSAVNKNKVVSNFQNSLLSELKKRMPNLAWQKEFIKVGAAANDRVDIYCDVKPFNWVIEIDTSRADQVGKKAFSRVALFGINAPIFYVAIIYPGTSSMNLNEVIKYSRYGYDIVKALNVDSDFRTIIIDCEHSCLRILHFVKNMKFTVDGIGNYSMNGAIQEATRQYLNRPGKTFSNLEKELYGFEGLNNHNGQEQIVSKTAQAKSPTRMQDNNGVVFYLTSQWMFFGENANFDAIIRFFKNRRISIEPKLEDRF